MLSDIKNLEPTYVTNEYNISKDFFNIVLKEANYYDRVSAYFTTSSLLEISEGITRFYCNNGKIRLIISQDISETDFEEVKKGYQDKIDKVSNDMAAQLVYENLSQDEINKISNVAYLIANGALDIKIAFKTSGIMHDKFGIIRDEANNCVYFKGSINFTGAAQNINYESFDVTCTWLNSEFECKKIDVNQERFNKMWRNDAPGLYIVDVPNVIKNNLLKFNRGKLFWENDEDTIIIDYNQNRKGYELIFGSNLSINTNNPYYVMGIKNYVKSIITNVIEIKENVTYVKFDYLKEYLNKYIDFEEKHEKINIKLIISPNCVNYINEKKYEIEKRYYLGQVIKEEKIDTKELEESFFEFNRIISDEMKRKLRIKQKWNSFHMVKMERSANFSVPGSGKTTMVYAAYAYLSSKEKNKVNKLIVIGPKSSFISWKDEFIENFGDKRQAKICCIADIDKKNLIAESANANIILVNYEALPSLEEKLLHIIKSDTMLVFDEIHKIKGYKKVRAEVALNISKNARYKYALTGTPIPNGYLDIYNMLNILYPEEYASYFGFSKMFLEKANDIDAERINKKIYPFFCRTTKKDLEVPVPNADDCIIVDASEDEIELFKKIKSYYKNKPFAYYIRMMQATNNPNLLLSDLTEEDYQIFSDDDETSEFEFDLSNKFDDAMNLNDIESIINKIGMTSKYKKTIELINKIYLEDKSVICWGIFSSTLSCLKDDLEKLGIRAEIIKGDVPLVEREHIIQKFKNGEFKVLIANPHTMAESVSLHKCCHDAIYFEYSFNLTHMLQSRDRINRLGLNENDYTQYYYLFSKYTDELSKSLDSIIYNRLKEKEEVMLNAIESGQLKVVKDNIYEDIIHLLK